MSIVLMALMFFLALFQTMVILVLVDKINALRQDVYLIYKALEVWFSPEDKREEKRND